MYIPSAKQPIGYLECPLDHNKNCGPHVKLDSISTSNDVPCSKSECQNDHKEAYMLLLTTVSDKGKCNPCHYTLFVIRFVKRGLIAFRIVKFDYL